MILKDDVINAVAKECIHDVNAPWRKNQLAASMKNLVPTSNLMPGSEDERIQNAFQILQSIKSGQVLGLPEKAPSLLGGVHTFFARNSDTHVTPANSLKPKR